MAHEASEVKSSVVECVGCVRGWFVAGLKFCRQAAQQSSLASLGPILLGQYYSVDGRECTQEIVEQQCLGRLNCCLTYTIAVLNTAR